MIVMNVRHNWRICCPPDNWFQSDGDTPTLSVADVLRRELVVIVAPAAVVPSPVVVWTTIEDGLKSASPFKFEEKARFILLGFITATDWCDAMK